ncbi:MAG: TraB/GumN family protein [Gammaproteobacteria bacterium]|nr:TraB/GumN family protein [Gammaproteobacteria bacterium]
MDVKTKPLFYRTAQILCGLMCLLASQAVPAKPVKKAVLHPAGLLWKIQKPNRDVSYLFGTIHIGDSRVLKLLDVVQDSVEASELFAMEVVLDDASMQTLSDASFFNTEQRLQDFIDEPTHHRIVNIMHQYYGIAAELVNKMKPWAVMATISSPPPESNRTVLDVELQNLAIDYQRPVVALETVEEQIEALSCLPMPDQLWILNKAVEDFEKSMGLWEQMIENYLQRDLQALVGIQESMMDDSSTIDDRFMDNLLDQRNIKMARRLISIMKNKSVFAAIGALHLPGEKGVLHLLEKEGYSVERLY